MKEYALGLLKSWTAWAGALLVAFPMWWPEVEPFVRDLIGVENYAKLVPVIGIVMVLLRVKTTQSISEKGMQ